MSISTVDFAAVGRVSKFAELKDIRLTDTSAKSDPGLIGPLESEFSHNCSIVKNENGVLDVACQYHFIGSASQAKVIDIEIKYLITYSLNSPEPLPNDDLSQFANANGTLHSWPFVREFLNSLTSRMGFPPFKLGVMHFAPLPAPPKSADANQPEATQAAKI